MVRKERRLQGRGAYRLPYLGEDLGLDPFDQGFRRMHPVRARSYSIVAANGDRPAAAP